jgi:hypothetical protein
VTVIHAQYCCSILHEFNLYYRQASDWMLNAIKFVDKKHSGAPSAVRTGPEFVGHQRDVMAVESTLNVEY